MNHLKIKRIFLTALFLFYADIIIANHFLSILIPCYNCEKTVEKTIESVYRQQISSVPFEVVCTDDCSTDNTLSLLRKFEMQYDNFKVVCHGTNQGGGAATNTCVNNAQGDLLYRLDSDNRLGEPGTVDRMIKLLDETGCDIVMVQIQRGFNEKTILGQEDLVFKGTNNIYTIEDAIKDPANPATSGNYMFTRESYLKAGGYGNDNAADTFCFGFKQLATGSKIAILPDSYYLHYINYNGYWTRETQAGRTTPKMFQVFFEYEEILDENSKKALRRFKNTAPINFWEIIHQKKLKLLPYLVLEKLFTGYDLLVKKHYKEALIYFKSAYAAGARSKRLEEIISFLENNK